MKRSTASSSPRDPHLRDFAKTLEQAIARYGDLSEEDVTSRQKRQVEALVGLEVDFRKAVISHPAGRKTYDAFAHYICQERRNILAARPFFRERQEVFMDHISPALKAGDGRALYPYGINYQFVRWVVGSRKWPAGSRVLKLAKAIDEVRTELVEMNMPLALSRAKIFWGRTRAASASASEVLPGGSHIAYMDLVQIAAEGLISGIDKFCLPYSPVFRSVAIGRMVGNFIEQFTLDSNTILYAVDQKPKKIKHFVPGDRILGVDERGRTIETEVLALHDHGMLDALEIVFDDGYQVTCSPEHKFLTVDGMMHIRDIMFQGMEVLCEPAEQGRWMEGILRPGPRVQADDARAPQGLRSMPSRGPGGACDQGPGLEGRQARPGGLVSSVRSTFCESSGPVSPSGCLSDLQGRHQRHKTREPESVAVRKSRGIQGQSRESFGDVHRGPERSGPVAYANAPLTDTGGLVRRRVVRVRYVGPRRMYDLEVAHPKHNFLLPNGIVTSNSETLIHFYPGDKKKIYRARKAIGRNEGFDINAMVEEINRDTDKKHWTNPGEVADLMSAAACESADAETRVSHEGDDESMLRIDTFSSDPEQQPDRLVETAELRHVLSSTITHLAVFERKFLRLRGVGF